MNFTLAIKSSYKGQIGVADVDFTTAGFATQNVTTPFLTYYDAIASINTLKFPQGAQTFNVKGLRYYYRPYWLGLNNIAPGDFNNVVLDDTFPAVWVHNSTNSDVEIIGVIDPAFMSYYATIGATWKSYKPVPMIVGAAHFECSFQDVIDVISMVNPAAGTPQQSGRIQLQFTEFEVHPYCKQVAFNISGAL